MKQLTKKGSLLNTREASHILDCCPDDILLWRKRGLIKAEGMKGRRYLYKAKEVRLAEKRISRWKRKNGYE
jgi:hypothetical protein